MHSNRKVVIIGIPIFLFVLSSGIMCRWVIAPPENPEIFLLAIPIGGITGLFVCWWLHRVWDPKTLSSEGQYNENTSGCWLPLAVISGIVFANIASSLFPYDFSQLIAASLGATIYMMFIYLWVQAVRYRHG